MMNPNLKLATMFIVVALGTVGTTAIAFAESEEHDEDEEDGIELADRTVHDVLGLGSEGDIVFHQGLCAAGITTEALEEIGGCEALPPGIGSDD